MSRSFSPGLSCFQLFYIGGAGLGSRPRTEPHRPGPREVHAVRQALPHLVAEEAGADALQVLRRDLQRGREDGGGERRSRPRLGRPGT